MQEKVFGLFVKPYLKRYLKKARWYRHGSLKLKIYPGVFHPAYFFSTGVFAGFVKGMELSGKSVVEVGAGGGLLSFIAYSKGARVHALDISKSAVKGLAENLESNFNETEAFSIYHSDLFDEVPTQPFDVFLINPPYFFSTPQSESAFAWYCGKNGEYFEKLFAQLGRYMHAGSEVFMILAENCDLQRITAIAGSHGYKLRMVHEQKVRWERNFIFRLELV